VRLERVPGAALCKNIQVKNAEYFLVVSVRRSSIIDLDHLRSSGVGMSRCDGRMV